MINQAKPLFLRSCMSIRADFLMSIEYSRKNRSTLEDLLSLIIESPEDFELGQMIDASNSQTEESLGTERIHEIIDYANESSKLGEFDTALRNLIIAKKMLQNKEFENVEERKLVVIRLLHAYAAIKMQKGKLDEAQDVFLQILEIKREEKIKGLSMSSVLVNLGIISWHKGKYEDALKYYHRALKRLDRPISNEMVSSIFNNIAIVYEQQGELEKALKFYQKSLELLKAENLKFQEGAILQNIGNIYRLQGKTKRSLKYLQDALEIFKELNHFTAIATVYESLGQYYRARGMLQKSLKYFQKSKNLFAEKKNKPLLSHVLFQMITLEIELGNKEHAIRYLKRLNWLLRESTSPSLQLKQKIVEVLYDFRFGKPERQVDHAQKLIRLLNDKGIDIETKIFIFAHAIERLLLHCDSEKNPEGFRQISNLVDDFLVFISSRGLEFTKPIALYFRAKIFSMTDQTEKAIDLLYQSIVLGDRMSQRRSLTLAKKLLRQIHKEYQGQKKFWPIRISNTIHSIPRLNILLYLYEFEKASFADLKKAVGLTAGNLSNHLRVLEKEELIKKNQGFVGEKPTMILEITPTGKEKLREYASSLEDLLRRIH